MGILYCPSSGFLMSALIIFCWGSVVSISNVTSPDVLCPKMLISFAVAYGIRRVENHRIKKNTIASMCG